MPFAKSSINYFLIILCSLFISVASAQVNYYSFSQDTSPYTEITGGVVLGDHFNNGYGIFLDPDTTIGGYEPRGEGFDIGFDFEYRGITYDRFGVANKGWIFLGKSSYDSLAVDIGDNIYQEPMPAIGPVNDTLRSRIIGFNTELIGNNSTSTLRYQLTGMAPNRILIIQWKDYHIASSFLENTKANFQIRLYEAGDTIKIQYGEIAFTGITGYYAQVGLSGFSFLEHHNRNTTNPHNWNSTSKGLTPLDICSIDEATTVPALGLTFQYAPASCVPPSSIDLYDLSTSSLSFTWQTPYTNPEEGYEYVLDQSISSPSTGTLITSDSITIAGLGPGNDYYLHIRSKCSSSLFSDWFTFPASTLCLPFSLPYFENFDGVSVPDLPPCIRTVNVNPESNEIATTTDYFFSAPNSLGFQCIQYSIPDDDWFFTPGFMVEEDSTYIMAMEFIYGDTLFIYAGIHPSITTMSPIDTLLFTYGFTSRYTLYTSPVDDTLYFGIRIKNCNTKLDDLSIKEYHCKVPEDFLITKNTGDSVLISWTHPDPIPMEYEYQLSESNQYPPGSVLTTDLDSLLFSSLTPSKDYYLLIRSSCGAGEFSPWILYPFTTVPFNDECNDAIELIPDTVFLCSLNTYSTIGATDSGIPPDSCGGIPDDDVWFKFIATERSHRIHIMPFFNSGGRPEARTATTGEEYTIELYAESCGSQFLNCANISGNSGEIIRTDLIIGHTYYVRVFGTNAYIGGSDFDICIGTIPVEPNDDCANALLMVSTGPLCENYLNANLAGTTPSLVPVSSCIGAPYYDVWYKFVATDTTHVVEVHFSNEGDGVVQAFQGDCENLVDIGCSNNGIPGKETLTLYDLVPGDTIYVRVFDAAGTGPFMQTEICVHIPHPNDECVGAISILTVTGLTMSDPTAGNTMFATGDEECDGNFADDDLWYKFIAEADTQLIVAYPTGYPLYLVYATIEFYGETCEGASLGCSNTGDFLATGLIPGHEYYFKIYSGLLNEGQGNFLLSITIPPANYTCSSAETIVVNEGNICVDTIIGTTVGSGINNEVWYAFVATDSSIVARTNYISGNGNFYLNFFDDCLGEPLLPGYLHDEIYYQHFIVGDTYYIRVNSLVFNTSFFQGTFSLCLLDIPNDECANALNIPVQTICTIPFQTSLAGATPSDVQDTCNGTGKDIWFRFTATSTYHELSLSTTGSLFAQGEVYLGSCEGNIIQCFTHNSYYAAVSNAYLANLQIGQNYYVRLKSLIGYTGPFNICISSSPPNDDCSQAKILQHPLTTNCNPLSSATGTTINATNDIETNPNVWYRFTAKTNGIAIRVSPTTPGFEPAIRIWKRSAGGGSGDLFCTTGLAIYTIDLTHASGQPEVMVYFGLIPDAEYLIEIYEGSEATTTGDFDICLSTLGSAMKIHSVDYKTYDIDSVATAGKWQQPVVKITLRMSGTTNNRKLTKVVVNTNGTSFPADIKKARLYVDTSSIILLGLPTESTAPFNSYGQPNTGLGGVPPPLLFGQAISNPNGTLTFTGLYTIKGGVNTNFNRDLYLVYDIKCDAAAGHLLNGKATLLTISGDDYIPFQREYIGLPIAPQNVYDTQQDGDWDIGSTWICDSPPPDSPDAFPIHINHQVTVSGTQQCGDLMIHYLRSLSIQPGSEITLGASSMGAASGHSNKYLDCKWGLLTLNNATININGGAQIGDHFHADAGGIHVTNSTINVDGEDGTSASAGSFLNLAKPPIFQSGFNINILDPGDFIYWGSSFSGENLNGTLKFGGGDDTSPIPYPYGFALNWGPGTFLRPDSMIIAGGDALTYRHVYGVAYAHHMLVKTGSEFSGQIVLNGDLKNNGLITIPEPRELSFCGAADGVNYFTNTSNAQTLSGTGFFRSDPNDPVPTSQVENQIMKLQVANTYSGLNLQMPLGIKDILRIRKGKINTTLSSILTLGDSLHAGTLVTVFPPPYQNDPYKFYTTPFAGGVSNWDGGFVNGPMKRWFQDTTMGEKSILPIGGGDLKHPVSVSFNSLDTGFITAQFISDNPGTAGLPLINEQGADLNNVSGTGYWHITSSGLIDTYDLVVNANGFTLDDETPITDLTNTRLIKRPDNGSWDYSGSTNTNAPITLDSVGLPGITGFSDFGISLDCNLLVTNAADSGPGSLRYIIDQCAQENDTIRFASNIHLLLITSDTIILDKNLYLVNKHQGQVLLQTTGTHSTFKINDGVEALIKDIDINTGNGLNGRAILNDGYLKLENVIITDTITGGSVIFNTGDIEILGQTQIIHQ